MRSSRVAGALERAAGWCEAVGAEPELASEPHGGNVPAWVVWNRLLRAGGLSVNNPTMKGRTGKVQPKQGGTAGMKTRPWER